MTSAQTMDVLNDSTTLQSRIDTVLAAPDLDWANDSGWQPGDPLYDHPWDFGSSSTQYVRYMVETIDDPEPLMRCETCDVDWSGDEACWLCGADCPRPAFGMTFGNVVLDETHDWSARMAEAMRPLVEHMGRVAEQFAEMSRRLHFTIDSQGNVFRFAEPEPEPEPAIRFPVGFDIAAELKHQPPAMTLAPMRPNLYRSRAEAAFWADAPATESRRPRRMR